MLDILDLGPASQVHRQWKQSFPEPDSFSQEQVKSYWESIFMGLNLPRASNANLSIAVPCYYNCLTRSTIMNILARDYGWPNIKLIPRSLALVGGFIALHPEHDLSGDLICILADGDNLDFSFISISESYLSLELQSVGSWANLQEEAGRLGLFSTQGWNISHLLYANPSQVADSYLPGVDLDNVNVIRVDNPDQTIQIGLRQCTTTIDAVPCLQDLRMIYPYDYYLERFDPRKNLSIRTKLAFDTANLELALNGTYKIASLPALSLYLDPKDSYVDLAVYEFPRIPWLQDPFNGSPALTLRLNQADQLECLDIWLDMESASISLGRDGPKLILQETSADAWLSHGNRSQRELAGLLLPSSNQRLQKDLVHDLVTKPRQASPEDLADYLKTMQLKLYGLLELWSGTK